MAKRDIQNVNEITHICLQTAAITICRFGFSVKLYFGYAFSDNIKDGGVSCGGVSKGGAGCNSNAYQFLVWRCNLNSAHFTDLIIHASLVQLDLVNYLFLFLVLGHGLVAAGGVVSKDQGFDLSV